MRFRKLSFVTNRLIWHLGIYPRVVFADSYTEDTESVLDVETRGGDVLDALSGYATDTEGGEATGAESSWELESMKNFPRRPRLTHNPSGITMPLLEEGALLLGHHMTGPSLVIKEVSFYESSIINSASHISIWKNSASRSSRVRRIILKVKVKNFKTKQ